MSFEGLIGRLKKDGIEELKRVYTEYREEFIIWLNRKYNISFDDAKDIYQFSMLKFYENVQSGVLKRLSSSPKTYIFAIGKNKALEAVRNKSRRMNISLELHSQNDIEGPDIKEAHLQTIEKAMQDLGEPCRTLLDYFYYQQKSLSFITEYFGYKNNNTAKNQKYKCLQRLKKLCFPVLEQLKTV